MNTATRTRVQVRRGDDCRDERARAIVEAAWIDAYKAMRGKRPRHELLDKVGALMPYLEYAAARDGTRSVVRTVPQIVRAMSKGALNWEVGATVHDTRQRYRSQIVSVLNLWLEAGWIDGWEALLDATGRGKGILIHLKQAPIAQGIERPPKRRPRRGAHRDSSSLNRLVPSPAVSSCSCCSTVSGECVPGAAARAARLEKSSDANCSPLPPWPSAALARLRTASANGVGRDALWRSDAPLDAVAIAAFEAAFGAPAMLSRRRRRHLLNAERVIDRCANFGAGGQGVAREQLRAMIEAYALDVERGLSRRPPSLAFFVTRLRGRGRTWRRHDRARRKAGK